MAEIKSTLDLVMERTKHLQLSATDRRQQKDKESGARLRGMLQKLHDRILSEERFAAEYEQLKSDYDLSDDSGLMSECLGRLSINGDNRAVLTALNSAAGCDRKRIGTIIEEFQDRYHERYRGTERRLAEAYASRYRLSGSALTPNPNRDQQWRLEAADLEVKFRNTLSEVAGLSVNSNK